MSSARSASEIDKLQNQIIDLTTLAFAKIKEGADIKDIFVQLIDDAIDVVELHDETKSK